MKNTTPAGPVPRPGILDIAPYIPGKSKSPASGPVYKLSSNETPLGPSPAAQKAYAGLAGELEFYPDGSASTLREAIASRHGLNPEHIVCGAGSDEILQMIAAAFLGPGDEAVMSQYGFLVYPIATMANGATPVVAPEKDYTASTDAMIDCVTPATKIVFLANPNNPTGTYLPFDEVRRLHAALPKDCLLVLDAAYAEYVRANDYEAGIELVSSFENVVMTRTFSKIYGLAGLRLGWAYCPPAIADILNRIRGPFNINAPAIAAGVAAINDTAHTEKAVEHNEKWLAWLTGELTALGLEVTPSIGNFILVHFAKGTAARADEFLNRRGLIVRAMGAYGLPDALRITIGSARANRAVAAALADFLAGQKG